MIQATEKLRWKMLLNVCLLLSVLISISAKLVLSCLKPALGLKTVNEVDVEFVQRGDGRGDSLALEKIEVKHLTNCC